MTSIEQIAEFPIGTVFKSIGDGTEDGGYEYTKISKTELSFLGVLWPSKKYIVPIDEIFGELDEILEVIE